MQSAAPMLEPLSYHKSFVALLKDTERTAEMTVVYGRIGSQGSTVTKMFDTEERAKREAGNL